MLVAAADYYYCEPSFDLKPFVGLVLRSFFRLLKPMARLASAQAAFYSWATLINHFASLNHSNERRNLSLLESDLW